MFAAGAQVPGTRWAQEDEFLLFVSGICLRDRWITPAAIVTFCATFFYLSFISYRSKVGLFLCYSTNSKSILRVSWQSTEGCNLKEKVRSIGSQQSFFQRSREFSLDGVAGCLCTCPQDETAKFQKNLPSNTTNLYLHVAQFLFSLFATLFPVLSWAISDVLSFQVNRFSLFILSFLFSLFFHLFLCDHCYLLLLKFYAKILGSVEQRQTFDLPCDAYTTAWHPTEVNKSHRKRKVSKENLRHKKNFKSMLFYF